MPVEGERSGVQGSTLHFPLIPGSMDDTRDTVEVPSLPREPHGGVRNLGRKTSKLYLSLESCESVLCLSGPVPEVCPPVPSSSQSRRATLLCLRDTLFPPCQGRTHVCLGPSSQKITGDPDVGTTPGSRGTWTKNRWRSSHNGRRVGTTYYRVPSGLYSVEVH